MKSGEKLFGKYLDFEREKFGRRVYHPVETTHCAVKIHIGMEWQSFKIWCNKVELPLIVKKVELKLSWVMSLLWLYFIHSEIS